LGGYEGVLREAIHQAKYERWRVVGTALGELLGAAIRDELEAAGVDPAAAVLVPMPTTLRRRMVRGVDHALVLSRGVNRVVGGRIARPIRRAHRRSQVEIPMSERARNVARAFWPTEGWLLGDWTRGGTARDLIVIDDVLTTGSTMRGACRAVGAAFRRAEGGGVGRGGRPRVWAAVVGFAGGGGSKGPGEGGASEF
jgi:predicted amidophosphoribosyltransferase